MAGAGECVGSQSGFVALFQSLGIHCAFAAVGIKGNGVEHTFYLVIFRSVLGILRHSLGLRGPALEAVAVLLIHGSSGDIAAVNRSRTVIHLLRLQFRAVPVLPGDGVLLQILGKRSREGDVAGNGGHIFRCPAGEGIGILRILFLCGSLTRIFGNR